MDASLRPLFEDALTKAKDIHRVFGMIAVVSAIVLLGLLVAIPAKGDDVLGKAGMAVICVLAFVGGAYKIRAARLYEADIRALFDDPSRAKGIVFVRVRKGPGITFAFHFDVGGAGPVVLPVLNARDFEQMKPLVVAHFPGARVG